MASETLRLEEWTEQLGNKMVAVWISDTAWLPTEFMLSAYITRILVVGRTATASIALAADQGWTQVWRSPGAKEWSCLLGILPHMPGPVLIVVGPDVGLTPKLVAALKGQAVFVLRSASGSGWSGDAPDAVFFPSVQPPVAAGIMAALQEWSGRAAPRNLDLRAVLPQLTAAGYALAVVDGKWHWYKPSESPPLATMTVSQIARQIQSLGAILERMIV